MTKVTAQAAPGGQTPAVHNPFLAQRSEHVSAATTDIEVSRAIAEIQAAITVAKARPRDKAEAFTSMIESCTRMEFAKKAFYAFPKGGQNVTGPSIRMAEELARNWGNIEYGIKELSVGPNATEMEAFAWDLETNLKSYQRFTVKHEMHTRSGVKRLTDPRDIYELAANQGARRLRARLLAILPPEYVEGAISQCQLTLAGGQTKITEGQINEMLGAFAQLNVTKEDLEGYIGGPLSTLTLQMFTELHGIYNAISEGRPKDAYFDAAGAGGAAQPTDVKNANERFKPQAPEAQRTTGEEAI